MRDETGADGTIKTYADLKIELPAGDVLAEAKEVALTGEYTIPEALYTFTAETNLYGMPGSEENANPTTVQLIMYVNYSVELSAPVLGGLEQLPVDSGIWTEV